METKSLHTPSPSSSLVRRRWMRRHSDRSGTKKLPASAPMLQRNSRTTSQPQISPSSPQKAASLSSRIATPDGVADAHADVPASLPRRDPVGDPLVTGLLAHIAEQAGIERMPSQFLVIDVDQIAMIQRTVRT